MKLFNDGKYHVSLLDTDQYKLSMQCAVCRLYPDARVRYEFIMRDKREFPYGFATRLKEVLDEFRQIYLRKEEKEFLREKVYYFPPMYLDFLEGYRYDPSEITVRQDGPDIHLVIEGFWYRTILWEVPLMATISELYFEMTGQGWMDGPELRFDIGLLQEKDKKKFEEMSKIGIPTSDFGTRRRHSYRNHVRVLENMIKNCSVLTGTSNVHLAMENNLTPIGTHAHEFFMYHAARYGFKMANQMALDGWVAIYNGDLGIALPDTFTTDVFLRAFNTKYAKLFDGVRQDSGNPVEFATKIVNHYRNLKINPLHKVIVFSDGINNLDILRNIKQACEGLIMPRAGIGTWITNDLPNIKPLNMVIKMSGVLLDDQWVPTVKLSDNKTKHTGDPKTIQLCKQLLNIP